LKSTPTVFQFRYTEFGLETLHMPIHAFTSTSSFNSVIRNLVLRHPMKIVAGALDIPLSIPLYGIWSWDLPMTKKLSFTRSIFQFRYTEFGLETETRRETIALQVGCRDFQFRYTEFGLETELTPSSGTILHLPFNSVIRNLVLRRTHAHVLFASTNRLSIPLYGIWSWDLKKKSLTILGYRNAFNSVIRNLVLRRDCGDVWRGGK